MGVAFGISFTYWFFTSIWYYILAYSLTTDLSFLHVLSITVNMISFFFFLEGSFGFPYHFVDLPLFVFSFVCLFLSLFIFFIANLGVWNARMLCESFT